MCCSRASGCRPHVLQERQTKKTKRFSFVQWYIVKISQVWSCDQFMTNLSSAIHGDRCFLFFTDFCLYFPPWGLISDPPAPLSDLDIRREPITFGFTHPLVTPSMAASGDRWRGLPRSRSSRWCRVGRSMTEAEFGVGDRSSTEAPWWGVLEPAYSPERQTN